MSNDYQFQGNSLRKVSFSLEVSWYQKSLVAMT